MESLPLFHRIAGQPVLLVGDGPAADAKARLIEAAGGIVSRDEAGARLAFVALDDEMEAAAVATRLKAAGLLVNVVDRPALCDFTVPAIVDRSPVVVAVGTGGASASLAKALRERLEAWLPASLGNLARAIHAARGAAARLHPTIDARRRLWDTALAPGGRLDPLAEPSTQDVGDALAAAIGEADSLTTIVLRSGDPDDLSLRELRLLNQADTVFHASAVPDAVLDRARRDAVRRPADGVPDRLPPGRSVIVLTSR